MSYPRVESLPTGRDFTVRWSFREGDFLIWIAAPSVLGGQSDLDIADFWELREGDFATITNRPTDLPSWFELHPTEVTDSLARQMMARLRAGYVPGDPVDGPNIWRVRAGARLVWVGERRLSTGAARGVLGLLDCRDSVLVIGEGRSAGLDEWMSFGSLQTDQLTEAQTILLREGINAARALGTPRVVATKWALG